MTPMFHVSSAANRQSILAHGLDWQRMGAACGIAGSAAPEANGVLLCADEFEAQFFVNMNNTGGPVDVWQVTGIDEEHLVDGPNGFSYSTGRPRGSGCGGLPCWRRIISASRMLVGVIARKLTVTRKPSVISADIFRDHAA